MTAASLIKPYLKKLVLQTHPDFFHREPTKSKLNSASLQQLYTFLNPYLKNEPKLRKQAPLMLAFYAKTQRNRRIVTTFEHGNEWQMTHSLLDLCTRLDIQVAASDREAVKSMMMNDQKKPKNLTKEFARAYYRQAHAKNIDWSPDLILQNKMLTFGPFVNKHQVADQWCAFMSQLEPERWWGILPALIVARKDAMSLAPSEQGRGILIFASDMGLDEMKNYLDTNLDIKRRERMSMNLSSSKGTSA